LCIDILYTEFKGSKLKDGIVEIFKSYLQSRLLLINILRKNLLKKCINWTHVIN